LLLKKNRGGWQGKSSVSTKKFPERDAEKLMRQKRNDSTHDSAVGGMANALCIGHAGTR
jgi:hypothetical protein